jgi:murein L,D-transpeptidase YcbB/YkuD
MSTRIDGDTRGALLVEDDDWFATVRHETVDREDRSWENELEWQLRDPAQPDLARRQAAIVLAVVVAVFLVFAGILIGRETKSSSTKVVTAAPTSQTEETPATTGTADTSAAATTPSTSTPSSSENTPSASTSTPSTSTPSTSTPSTSTPSTSTPNTSTPSPTAVPTDATLRVGTKGDAVITLQTALASLGYAPGTADGTYGATTAQAVTAFQTAKNLTADGAAGAQTLAAINAALASG